jgi:hypothetical protein
MALPFRLVNSGTQGSVRETKDGGARPQNDTAGYVHISPCDNYFNHIVLVKVRQSALPKCGNGSCLRGGAALTLGTVRANYRLRRGRRSRRELEDCRSSHEALLTHRHERHCQNARALRKMRFAGTRPHVLLRDCTEGRHA